MPDKWEEFVRETTAKMLNSLPLEERLKGLSAEEIIKALPPAVMEELARRLNDNDPLPDAILVDQRAG